jgi:prepilin-type N-terminal cleavage/methylation domain-containing protein
VRVSRTRFAGFTLIEMLVVVAIAGLIAGIAYPRVQTGMSVMEFRMGAGQVVAALQSARAEAIRTGEPVAIRIGEQDFAIGDASPVALPASVRILAGQDGPVTFYPDGTAVPALFRIRSRGGEAVRERRVTVFGSTGFVAESGQ